MNVGDIRMLANELREEKLLAEVEQQKLRDLEDEVGDTEKRTQQQQWIYQNQRQQLESLVRGRHGTTEASCCAYVTALQNAHFTDGYKVFTYNEPKFGAFLSLLRCNPKALAFALYEMEKAGDVDVALISSILVHSLYGGALSAGDQSLLLHLLMHLSDLQLPVTEKPLNQLLNGKTFLSVILKLFCDSIFSIRLYISTCLYQPVITLLKEDEWFYDIDWDRALYRFPPEMRLEKFGSPGTPQFEEKTAHYRAQIYDKLHFLASTFIASVNNTMANFPPLLGQFVSHVNRIFQGRNVNGRKLCAELIFSSVLCPAICDPSSYISDVPVGYIAKHNLMQVAQILQVLAVSNDVDPKFKQLYARFDPNCLTAFVDNVIRATVAAKLDDTLGDTRKCMYATQAQLEKLVEFVRRGATAVTSEAEKSVLKRITRTLPRDVFQRAFSVSSRGSDEHESLDELKIDVLEITFVEDINDDVSGAIDSDDEKLSNGQNSKKSAASSLADELHDLGIEPLPATNTPDAVAKQHKPPDLISFNGTAEPPTRHRNDPFFLQKVRRKKRLAFGEAKPGITAAPRQPASATIDVAKETESIDDILSKYRTPVKIDTLQPDQEPLINFEVEEVNQVKDDFNDLKRKTQMVLSICTFDDLERSSDDVSGCSYLRRALKLQLSCAFLRNDREMLVKLQSYNKSIDEIGEAGLIDLLTAVKSDLELRKDDFENMQLMKRSMLMRLSTLGRLTARITKETESFKRHLVSVLLRSLLEGSEGEVLSFSKQFKLTTVMDEKIELFNNFSTSLAQKVDGDALWCKATSSQQEMARNALHSYVITQIYTQAFFPNGDGDVLRDKILQEHIQKLSATIMPTHKKLRIPAHYAKEAPWEGAQQELGLINIFKNPKDKVACVVRACAVVMNLLTFSHSKTVPGADDFMPVLIFVLIKANPSFLMSNIQYVNNFYSREGEEEYYWMQFSSAVEFIKTM